jgi:hypothetical protein
LEEVERVGEFSLVFIDGEFSHAVLKRPGPGDFRVQRKWGGDDVPVEVPLGILQDAERVVAALSIPWLYARVDGVLRMGHLLLMEVELIEPTLFLSALPPAAERFADAILSSPSVPE